MRELEEVTTLLLHAATVPPARKSVVRLLTTSGEERLVATAADLVLVEVVARLLRRGWQPYDVHRITLRRADARAAALAGEAVAEEVSRRPAATLDPRWREQLARVGAEPWWQGDRPRLTQWAERHGRTFTQALSDAVGALAVLATLPALPELPLPAGSREGVDEKMLARVRALLAKAESTPYPEEAEALSAKAQELMSRYSFEQALVQPRATGAARRFWLDEPYLAAKASLVTAVATANRCRAVSYEKLGFLAVVGHEVDLDIVELLATSLLVQATEAMLAAGSRVGSGGRSRTRSFRHAFLLSYATRIGERLREADTTATAEVADSRLLPVLARRGEEVEALFVSLFPTVARRTHTVSNGEGWHAGRAAADQAKLTLERRRLSV
ncbi:hypothetical protein FHX82_006175 [Amycolatopsis bartoniae]|uniref:DUF2786 domain-containing protein n=1 Tax=Amycolatopsis bartoniae TaxID=941986 RepID=A0A8H9J2H3_9PSEU|nr:DUF2786 domain-containing protein [Amycolatopsis bartoniae]MBB2939089.1 hypothetical protein [Amycolatopsis bartoniae]TVT06343.1 DUF2786 domain-containing protein [Amycolatopsis bartoniae]GHF65005.1 hypothetical protein GCM10017566_43160 [Amycolatopsis bartoniae]